METFLKATARGSTMKVDDEEAEHERELEELRANVGEQMLELDAQNNLRL